MTTEEFILKAMSEHGCCFDGDEIKLVKDAFNISKATSLGITGLDGEVIRSARLLTISLDERFGSQV